MKRVSVTLVWAACILAIGLSAAAQKPEDQIRRVYTAEELDTITPSSPNPYLAFIPEGVEPDWEYWNSWMRVEQERREAARGVRAGISILETESNDTIESPNLLPNFGTGMGQNKEVTISGTTGFPPGVVAAEPTEDNGSIVFAPTIPLSASNRFYAVSGEIGNGQFGSSGFGTGDFDFYRVRNVPAGQILEMQVDARSVGSSLNPAVIVYNASGTFMGGTSNDIVVQVGQETVILDADATFRFTVPAFGDYYVVVFGEPEDETGALMSNPFSSQSGPNLGTLAEETEGFYDLYLRLFSPVTARAENNGSINISTIAPSTGGVYASTIGDGPFGAGSGDFDFYAVPNLKRGDLLIADVDASILGSSLDPFVAIWNSSGDLAAWNDDDPFHSFIFEVNGTFFQFIDFDSFIAFEVPADGTYFVSVGSFLSPYPLDPFDASSGTGAASTGSYELVLRVQPHNPDVFALDLTAGDVVGADLTLVHGNLELLDPAGKRIVESHTNLTGIYPEASPLPGDGSTALGYIVPQSGRYFVRVSSFGIGSYVSNVSVFRPALETSGAPEPRQRLFIDFDGVDNFSNEIFGVGTVKVSNISGLGSFLGGWGLEPEDVDDVIDAILAVVRESLIADLRPPFGRNSLFDIELLNSRDHADPWGEADVSRVIVGGTISQLGIATIGIAESIDIGNFDTTETAIVLLDLLSSSETNPNSLNGIERALGADIVALIGEAVGNIVAHEAGHFFGDFHTDNFITPPNIMDEGGNLANTIGLGADGVFGSVDDIDVDFGVDQYAFLEGFSGFEDTLNVVAMALSAPPGKILYVDFKKPTNGVGTLHLPFNNMADAVATVPQGGRIRLFSGTSAETFSGLDAIVKRVTIEAASPHKAVIGVE